jgi:hypothetical protein
MERMTAIWRALRSVIVLLALAAWFGLSNHCALAVTAGSPQAEEAGESCPMHSAPEKKKPAAKTPCCKEVRAVVAKSLSKVLTFTGRSATRAQYAWELVTRPPTASAVVHGLDTGPPGFLSFAESVLQESMLAHAPPVS